jgi:glycosyltransferase involved in cell wall biosynthesis
MLGADPTLFHGGKPLHLRPRTILYVGRLVSVKNVTGLTQAFLRFSKDHPDWLLRICGSGVQRGALPSYPQIHIEDFVQPPQLAEIMREARCLVLPSLFEPWGVVVHEAALSGCALALSKAVGAADDLARPDNAVLFKPGNGDAIERALRWIADWDDHQWQRAESTSRELAKQFGPEKFADAVDRFIEILGV